MTSPTLEGNYGSILLLYTKIDIECTISELPKAGLRIIVFWDTSPCRPINTCRRFRGPWWLRLDNQALLQDRSDLSQNVACPDINSEQSNNTRVLCFRGEEGLHDCFTAFIMGFIPTFRKNMLRLLSWSWNSTPKI